MNQTKHTTAFFSATPDWMDDRRPPRGEVVILDDGGAGALALALGFPGNDQNNCNECSFHDCI